MRAVNLLPREAQPRTSFHGSGVWIVGGVAVAAVVLVALGAGYTTAHSHAASARQQLAEARSELTRVDAELHPATTTPSKPAKPTKPIVPVPAVTAEQEPRLAALSSALTGRIAWDRVLREFSLVMPADVTVSSLSMEAPEPGAATSSASGFTLNGLAFSHDSVARLLARLMLVPDLTGVSLATSTADPITGQVTFTIDAAVRGAAAPGASS